VLPKPINDAQMLLELTSGLLGRFKTGSRILILNYLKYYNNDNAERQRVIERLSKLFAL
jgi:hypothetical protein